MAKILVVDDQPIILLTVDRILSHHKYDVLTANNVFDALEILRKTEINLIITDAIMPGRSGYDLSAAVRKNPQLQSVPIIMLTGKRDKRFVEKGIEAGINDYLIKPLDGEILISKVKTLLNKGLIPSQLENGIVVNWSAQWKKETRLLQISDSNILIRSDFTTSIGLEFTLEGSFCQDIGISAPTVRTLECKADELETGTFIILTSFVNLTDEEKQKIHQWLDHQKSRSAA